MTADPFYPDLRSELQRMGEGVQAAIGTSGNQDTGIPLLQELTFQLLDVDPGLMEEIGIVGVVEIIVGLAILFGASRVFGYIAILWLCPLPVNLISTGMYYDIAVRGILLGLGAYALARVTEARYSDLYVERGEEYRPAA